MPQARLFRAPGRVNLIGEHTDYNDGFVLPAAINYSTWIRLVPRDDRRLIIFSKNFSEQVEFDLDDEHAEARGHWSDYPIGVAVTLQRAGYQLRGAVLNVSGEIPLGSGLSSSAAIEVATALALLANSETEIGRIELARLCRQVENEFVGARVGIMDQFVSLCGQANHAVLLDCRSLEHRSVPLPDEVRLVVCNTMVKHELANSAYNERRAQCEAGVKQLSSRLQNVQALRDVGIEQLEQYARDLPDVVYRRCRHVISENGRTLNAARALEERDVARFGRLMGESHRSLRDDFEVSCTELDLMVELAQKVEGVYGARLTGGGFGGCTINLVARDAVAEFERNVLPAYQTATGVKPEMYVCEAADGAGEVASAVEID